MHRHHHEECEGETDIHSPFIFPNTFVGKIKGFLWSQGWWVGERMYIPNRYELVRDLFKFPELFFIDRIF